MNIITVQDLAQDVGAQVVGDGSRQISGANPLRDAKQGDITLLDDSSRSQDLNEVQATAVVVSEPIEGCPLTQVVASDVHAAFTSIASKFRPLSINEHPGEINPTAHVDPSASISSGVSVGPGCVIGPNVQIATGSRLVSGVTIMSGCKVGENVTLFPGVVLYENTVLEDRVCIHAGSVLGAHGFGYRQVEGRHVSTGQLGYVHVESDVEIGASVTIDRGTYGSTRIGCGTKIDNLVMIAHNCHIGKHNLICSQVGVAGSCTTGDYVILAGQVGLKDHINLGDGVIVGAQAGVMNDCEAGNVYLGSPATKQKEQMQMIAMWRRLPDIRRSVKKLEQAIAELPSQTSEPSDSAKAA